jgi:hypothetical protein
VHGLAVGHDHVVFVRPRDLEPIDRDLTLILQTLMGIDAKLDEIRYLLGEDDDGEEEAPGP